MFYFGISMQSVHDALRRTVIDALKTGGYSFDSN
jgi:hypothetical protein